MGLGSTGTWTEKEVIRRAMHKFYAVVVPGASISQVRLDLQRLMLILPAWVVILDFNEAFPLSNKSIGCPGASAEKFIGATDFLACG